MREDVLEFLRGNVRLHPQISTCVPWVLFCGQNFRIDAEHPLKGIKEQNRYEPVAGLEGGEDQQVIGNFW